MGKVEEVLLWQSQIRKLLNGQAYDLTDPNYCLDMAPHAVSWVDLGDKAKDWLEFFGPASWKVWRLVDSFDPAKPVKAKPHGGSCFVTTADLHHFRGRKVVGPGQAVEIIESYPTLGQIIDAVLPIPGYPILFISEDDLFLDFWAQTIGEGRSLKSVREAFQRQIERTVKMTQNWAEFLTGQPVSVRNVLFSEVGEELELRTKEWLATLSELLGKPLEMKDRAKVVYSYVGPKWLEIIGEEGIIIAEPLHHNVNPASMARIGRPLYDFHLATLEYYQRYRVGRELENTHLVGYLGTLGAGGQLAYDHTRQEEGACFRNRQEYVQKALSLLRRPFPLNESPLFLDAVNLLFFDSEHRQRILELIELEQEYREKKKAGLVDRASYQEKAVGLLSEFYSDIEAVLEIIGF